MGLWHWLWSPREGSTGARGYECPRCGGAVDVAGLIPIGMVGRMGHAPPTVAEVVNACGCERTGRAPVAEWPERARRRSASW